MKSRNWFLVLTLSLISIVAQAEVRSGAVELRVVEVTPGSTSIQFCEFGSCRDLGHRIGFSAMQWSQIRSRCAARGLYETPVRNLLTAAVNVAGVALTAATGSPVGMIVAGLGTSAIGADVRAIEQRRNAGELLPGALDSRSQFVVSVDVLIGLRDGIAACAQDFENEVRTQRMLRDCATLLNASECRVRPYDEPAIL